MTAFIAAILAALLGTAPSEVEVMPACTQWESAAQGYSSSASSSSLGSEHAPRISNGF
ncbi:MAG: hypothetical protein JXB39_00090 [Deltaproteobacteria bacterium]|nr:hypothetical protein [Deltaproteobacteria bacterium]